MIKLVYYIGAIGFLVSCGGPAEEPTNTETKDTTKEEVVIEEEVAPENSFLLEPGVVGVFKIGQPIGKLPLELTTRKSTVSRTINGTPEDHLQHIVFNSLEDLAEITMEKNDNIHEDDLVIIDMRVMSNYYETKDGIKVGSTVTELTGKYADTKFRYNGSTGEIVGESASLTGIQFVIDPAGCTKKTSGTKDIALSTKNFTEDAKIKFINVF